MSENKNKKVQKRVFLTRILCLILALIMIGSVCYLAIQLIIDAAKEKKEQEKLNIPTIFYAEEPEKAEEDLL